MQIAYPTLESPKRYLSEVIKYRRFWVSLAQIDLKNRFRRTYLGILWIVIQPLMFTLILSLMFHFIFKQEFLEFSVYVFSGVTFWAWFSETFVLGANSIIQSQAFIRQKRLPFLVYFIRTFLVSSFSFLLGFVGLIFWLFLTGHTLGVYSLLLPFNLLYLGLALFPVIVFSGVIGALYRDYQQLVQLVLQALWFVSPVFIDKTVFLNPGISVWNYFNPVSNMLALIRRPLMDNQMPTLGNYLLTALFALIVWTVAYRLLKQHEKNLVYYL